MGLKCEPCGHVMSGNPIMKDHEDWMDSFPVIQEVMVDPLMSAMRKTDNWITRRLAYLEDGLKKSKAKLARTRSPDRKKQLKGAVESWEHRIENDPIDVTFSNKSIKFISINCPKCGSSLHSYIVKSE